MTDKHGFFHFAGGARIGDATVGAWLNLVRAAILDGECHHTISSGDTLVAGVRYDDYIHLYVAQTEGYASYTLRIDELPFVPLNWERPKRPKPDGNGRK